MCCVPALMETLWGWESPNPSSLRRLHTCFRLAKKTSPPPPLPPKDPSNMESSLFWGKMFTHKVLLLWSKLLSHQGGALHDPTARLACSCFFTKHLCTLNKTLAKSLVMRSWTLWHPVAKDQLMKSMLQISRQIPSSCTVDSDASLA